MKRETAWFRPKTHGYGASPANWKGWLATAIYAAAVTAGSFGVFGLGGRKDPSLAQWSLWIAGVAAVTIAFVALARWKTDGAWHWRWGAD